MKLQKKLCSSVKWKACTLCQEASIWLLWYMETAFRILPCLWQKRLSPLDSVLSTATHFILTRYKEGDVILTSPKEEDRRNLL